MNLENIIKVGFYYWIPLYVYEDHYGMCKQKRKMISI